MAQLWGVLIVLLYLASVMICTVSAGVTARHCKWNQLTILRAEGIECLDCPDCPEGLGLRQQCGSRITADAIVECVACVEGISYSDEHSLSSCKPCSICDPNEETITRCTVKKNAVCGKCKAGFYRALTGDCHPCSWCCASGKDEDIEEQCSEQTDLPPSKVCRYDVNTALCGPASNSTLSAPITDRIHVRANPHRGKGNNLWLVLAVGFLLVVVCGGLIFLRPLNSCKRRPVHYFACTVTTQPKQAMSEHQSVPIVAGLNSHKGTCL